MTKKNGKKTASIVEAIFHRNQPTAMEAGSVGMILNKHTCKTPVNTYIFIHDM